MTTYVIQTSTTHSVPNNHFGMPDSYPGAPRSVDMNTYAQEGLDRLNDSFGTDFTRENADITFKREINYTYEPYIDNDLVIHERPQLEIRTSTTVVPRVNEPTKKPPKTKDFSDNTSSPCGPGPAQDRRDRDRNLWLKKKELQKLIRNYRSIPKLTKISAKKLLQYLRCKGFLEQQINEIAAKYKVAPFRVHPKITFKPHENPFIKEPIRHHIICKIADEQGVSLECIKVNHTEVPPPAPPLDSNCTVWRQYDIAVKSRLAEIKKREETLKRYKLKYASLLDPCLNFKHHDESKTSLSSFQRGLEDQKHLSIFQQNQLLYPEGSLMRLSSAYLEENMSGPAPGIGGNLAYFTGSLVSHMRTIGKNTQSKLQAFANFVDPNHEVSCDVPTVSLGIDVKNMHLSKKAQMALQMSRFAEERGIAMHQAIQNGANSQEVFKDALASAQDLLLSNKDPKDIFYKWDEKLKNASKGVAHGIFDFAYQSYQDVKSFSFYLGAQELENILSSDERMALQKDLINRVERHQDKTSSFVQKILHVDSMNATYLSARKLTHLGLNAATLAVGGYGAIKALKNAKISTLANRCPRLLNHSLDHFAAGSKDHILKFKIHKIQPQNSKELGYLQVKAYQRKHLQMNFLNGPNEAARREASIILHQRAKIALKPYTKQPMSELEARRLIENTGIPTFPRPEGIPESYLVQISEKGAGIIYIHPYHNHTSIRVMPGKPHSPLPFQRNPYVIYRKNGLTLDKFGKIVGKEVPEAHISLNEFIFDISR